MPTEIALLTNPMAGRRQGMRTASIALPRLRDAGIRVFAVGIGSRSGERIPTYAPDGTWTGDLRDDENNIITTALTEENEAQLRQIAELTGGRYFHAGRGQVGVDQVREALRQFKSRFETGEVPTTEGQPSGRRSLLTRTAKAIA